MPTVYKGFDYEVKSDSHGPYVIKNELYNTNSAFNEVTRPNLVYDIYVNPPTGNVKTAPVSMSHIHDGYVKISPKQNNNGVNKYHAFRWSAKKVETESYDLEFVESANGYKVFTKVRNVDETTAKDLVMDINTTTGARDIEAIGLDASLFDFPKPVSLIQFLSGFGSGDEDIVLDFFAGSGTTAHAILQQNAEDGGNRKFVLVQLPEPMAKPKKLNDGTIVRTIADSCRSRMCRAGRKVREDHASTLAARESPLDTGFRAYRLAASNFRPWDGSAPEMMTSARQASFMPQNRQLSIEDQLRLAADHIRPDVTDDALLAELLLRTGFDLTTPVVRERMAGTTVYNVEDGTMLVCLDRQITLDVIEAMASTFPNQIVCLDAGFPDDQTKVNAGQIIASHARDEETSIAFKVV